MESDSYMNLTERFLKYAAFDTQSDPGSATTPGTAGQRALAEAIAADLADIGMKDIELDEACCLMATLPANAPQERPAIGFIAHLDTSPDAPGKNVKPRIVSYNGGDIVLSEKNNIILSPSLFPELNDYVGQELIVADGTTLLGADDKAGVAAIVEAMKYLTEHPEVAHGKVRIGFTPDEEIGRGADHFDVEKFACQWAYTVDGGQIGELQYENFNAATATVDFKGRSVHPGEAKDKMINAAMLAAEFVSWLPPKKRPEFTEGYEGFVHLTEIGGTVEKASLTCILRDHDEAALKRYKIYLETIVERMNEKHPGSVAIHISDQYRNMRPVIEHRMHIIELARKAMEAAGVQPIVRPIRGGTDGARLSWMGLPCPNIFAGGHNFHGPYEFLPVKSLEKSMQTIIKIIEFT
jgi:tripeptide aminopeptidase